MIPLRDLMSSTHDASVLPAAHKLLRLSHHSLGHPICTKQMWNQTHFLDARIHGESCSSDHDDAIASSFGFPRTCERYLYPCRLSDHTVLFLFFHQCSSSSQRSSSSQQTEIDKDKSNVHSSLTCVQLEMFQHLNLCSNKSHLGEHLAGATV